jgi:hypothetical protein
MGIKRQRVCCRDLPIAPTIAGVLLGDDETASPWLGGPPPLLLTRVGVPVELGSNGAPELTANGTAEEPDGETPCSGSKLEGPDPKAGPAVGIEPKELVTPSPPAVLPCGTTVGLLSAAGAVVALGSAARGCVLESAGGFCCWTGEVDGDGPAAAGSLCGVICVVWGGATWATVVGGGGATTLGGEDVVVFG